MYLIVGGTGPVGLGGEICRLLRSSGRPTRALVRPTSDARRTENLRKIGVELVQGDLKDRESLKLACQGVRCIISTASILVSRQPDDTVEAVDGHGQTDLIDIAKAGGVESFVYTSISGRIDRQFAFRDAKRGVERHLKGSGLSYTILRPTFYMEVWLSAIGGFDYAHRRATIYGEGRNRISWLSFYDVARFALMCLDSVGARNATFEIGGPEALSPLEVVNIFEDVWRHRFNVEFVSAQTLAEQESGGEDSWTRSIAGLRRCYADGDVIDMRALAERFPMTWTSVRDYAHRVCNHEVA
jgi:NADH dehydrogenase